MLVVSQAFLAGAQDSDFDGILDIDEFVGDTDGDGTFDVFDNDDDGDGVLTRRETGIAGGDADGDGVPNHRDTDDDNDGIPTNLEGDHTVDTDRDGLQDPYDPDDDNDGVSTRRETADNLLRDVNNDGRVDHLRNDEDGFNTLPKASLTATVQRIDHDQDINRLDGLQVFNTDGLNIRTPVDIANPTVTIDAEATFGPGQLFAVNYDLEYKINQFDSSNGQDVLVNSSCFADFSCTHRLPQPVSEFILAFELDAGEFFDIALTIGPKGDADFIGAGLSLFLDDVLLGSIVGDTDPLDTLVLDDLFVGEGIHYFLAVLTGASASPRRLWPTSFAVSSDDPANVLALQSSLTVTRASSVSEPAGLAILGAGLLGLCAVRRRRYSAAEASGAGNSITPASIKSPISASL